MYKIGLKLWSTNIDSYFDEAKRLYQEGLFDYIELYVVPETIDTIDKWKSINVPFTLHAPHFAHGVNLALQDREEFNRKIFDEVKLFNESLNAKFVVVHSGIEGDIEEAIRQLNIIKLENMLIENKPYRAPLGEKKLCRGATIEEIKLVLNNVNCGFCLDVGHAICSANSFKLDQYTFLEEFNKLNPTCYHLSDNSVSSSIDNHLHFGQGDYDFKKIFDIIDSNKNLVIETNKVSKINLDDFRKDVEYIRNLEKRFMCK